MLVGWQHYKPGLVIGGDAVQAHYARVGARPAIERARLLDDLDERQLRVHPELRGGKPRRCTQGRALTSAIALHGCAHGGRDRHEAEPDEGEQERDADDAAPPGGHGHGCREADDQADAGGR